MLEKWQWEDASRLVWCSGGQNPDGTWSVRRVMEFIDSVTLAESFAAMVDEYGVNDQGRAEGDG